MLAKIAAYNNLVEARRSHLYFAGSILYLERSKTMDLLNNLSVVISIIIGVFGIVGYFFGIVAYFRHKADSSQPQQTIQLQSSLNQISYQKVPKSFICMDSIE